MKNQGLSDIKVFSFYDRLQFAPSILLLLLWLSPAWSDTGPRRAVEDLHSATVVVEDHSGGERSRALRKGLRQVITKLTGSAAVADLPELAEEYGRASTYVVEYGYTSVPTLDDGASETPALKVRYSEPALEKLLRRHHLPIWPANRPRVLVWLVTDERDSGRRYVSREDYPGVPGLVERIMTGRGVPLQMPLLDLQDEMIMPAADAWDFDRQALEEAAGRYGARAWVVIRYFRSSGGDWRGSWLLTDSELTRLDNISAPTLPELLSGALGRAVDLMAARYTYVPNRESGRIGLALQNIGSYRDYVQVTEFLSSLEMVRSVRVSRVAGSELVLSLELEGEPQFMFDLLARDRRFSQPSPDTDARGYYVLHWERP